MDEQYSETDRPVTVSPSTKPDDNLHGDAAVGQNTYTERECVIASDSTKTSSRKVEDEETAYLKHVSRDGIGGEDISGRDFRITEHEKYETKLDKDQHSNISVLLKSSVGEKEDREEINTTLQDVASKDYRFNESLKEAGEQYEYFWQGSNPLSQWYYSKFELKGQTFCCAEQYMMYTKAELLHDDQLAKRIMTCTDPSRIKSLGRKTKQFSEDLWVHNCLHVVKEGNMAKFKQNVDLKQILIGTYPRILVEASPFDKVWGIGFKKENPCAWNEATWEGKNLLGYILTEVRDELMFEHRMIQKDQRKIYLEKLTNELVENCSGEKGAYDRYPSHIYSPPSASRRTTEDLLQFDDFGVNKKEDEKACNKSTGKEGTETVNEDFPTRLAPKAPVQEADNDVSVDHDDVRAREDDEAGLSLSRTESKHETDISINTNNTDADRRKNNVCAEKRNKNENPRCTNKLTQEQNYRAVCMEPIEPERRLYKPECN